MAISSIGYQGSITSDDQWGRVSNRGSNYSVDGVTDFAVTRVPTGDRAVRVAAGTAWGWGILADSPTDVTVTHPAPTATRWDTVVIRRNRDTSATTVLVLPGTGAKAIASSRRRFSDQSRIDDQPIALVQVNPASSVVGEIEDLRCWGSNGGLMARSVLVMGYLDQPGTKVRIGGFEWSLEFDSSGTLAWTRTGGGRLLAVVPGAFYNLPPSGRFGPSVQVWGSTPQSIAQVSIPDPGVPYRIGAAVVGRFGSEVAGTRWDLDYVVGSDILSIYEDLGVYSEWKRWSIDPSGSVFTGAQTLYLRARRISGSGFGALDVVQQRAISARIWQA